MGAGEAQFLAQEFNEKRPLVDTGGDFLAVHNHRDLDQTAPPADGHSLRVTAEHAQSLEITDISPAKRG
jgi:hypothetical protein